MFSLARISLVNWYLVGAKDIDIRGEAALIGPTGAGKSSIQDAIQTVITGANGNRLALNASASGRSSRSVLEYCLGMTGDPSEDGRPLRSSCETILALTFRDGRDGAPITVGLALAARAGDAREEVLSRFVLPGLAFSVEDVKREADGVATVAPWSEIAVKLRAACPAMEEHKTSAERFTQSMLAAMRGPGRAPNPRHFLRAFSNALAFKPIFDPTQFVRDFVLEPDPLDVERVRTSIATWREFERLIRDAETRHRQAAAVAVLFADWARDHRAAALARWRAASFEARRAAHEMVQAGATLRVRTAELETERRVLASRREWIRGWDEEIRSKTALAAAADGEARLGRIDAEAGLAERDLADGERVFVAVSGALRELARLGAQFPGADASATDAAREAVALIGEAPRFPEVLRGRGDRMQALLEDASSTAGWQGALDEEADRLADEIRRHQGELDRIEAAPARPGGLLLSREVAKLLAALEREGIPAFPLCEVVDVADASWQYAAEALLGRGREAVVVQPPLLARAFDVMWSDRNSFSGCTLVKTSATASTRALVTPGSILEALRTEDAHARAFLAVRIGAFRKAETEAELDRLERGVMRNGKTSSGMGLTVQRDLRELLFGRAAADAGAAGREAERERLRRTVADARARIASLRNAGRSLASLAAVLRAQPDLADLEEKALKAQRRREVLHAERRQVSASDSGALRAEIEDIRAERDGHLAELREEVEPLVEALGQAVASGRAKLGVAREKLGEAVRARRAAWGLVAGEEHRSLAEVARGDGADDAGAGLRLRAEIATLEEGAADAKGLLALRRNEAKAAAETARESARRRQIAAVRELADHLSRWRAEGPRVETEGMAAAALWIAAEVRRLETNELIGYRERCAEAGAQMRAILREDLLSRLAEKLERVSHRLAGINRLLKRHRFTGQTYAFTHAVDGRFARMHELAVRSAAGELTEEAFASSMDEVEALIEGAEEAAQLADYRRYFTFEIVMTDERGARTTLSSRALKGSGGEAQVPFYVAIAASLALAYFPGHVAGRPVGMGLALFDEAFNKLDVPNTQALLRFFRDMGLQLLIAGPEDKRATFTEVLDTIVLVNKSLDGRSVYIDTEHPGEAARDALSRLNPDHRGIEGFRSAAE